MTIYEVNANLFIEAVDAGDAVAKFIERVGSASAAEFDSEWMTCGAADMHIQIIDFHSHEEVPS